MFQIGQHAAHANQAVVVEGQEVSFWQGFEAVASWWAEKRSNDIGSPSRSAAGSSELMASRLVRVLSQALAAPRVLGGVRGDVNPGTSDALFRVAQRQQVGAGYEGLATSGGAIRGTHGAPGS